MEIWGKLFCLLPDNKIRGFHILPTIDYVIKAVGNQYGLSKIVKLACLLGPTAMPGCHSLSSDEGWPDCRAMTSSLGVGGPCVAVAYSGSGVGPARTVCSTIDSLAFKALQSGKPWRKMAYGD